MAVLKITDLVDKSQIEDIKELDRQLGTLSTTFKGAAMELAKGLKIKIEAPKDLDKLYNLYNSQAKVANETTQQFASTLEKEKAILMEVASQLEKQAASGNLSTKQMKELSDATQKNAQALERIAKAEAAAERAQQTSNRTRKNATLSEEERKRVIKEAIELSKQEVHSINEANEVNKKLREAVKMVKTTDEDYLKTLGQLNGAIGVNTDLVRRNSDRYTQQKMNIGNYKDSIKQAYAELRQGNNVMQNMGIIARNSARILNSEFSSGIERMGISVGGMIKGFVGAQAIIGVVQQLVGKFKEGVNTAIEFQATNSTLAAILGTTAAATKELQIQARNLGATTKYTAAEASSLQIELAKLGFTTREISLSTEHVLRFAQATGASLPEAASLAGAALRMFGADASEMERYVSVMAISTARSALSFSKLATALPIVGPIAKSFNFSIEDTVTLLGKLSDAGFDASMAATATRNILLNLADTNGKLAQRIGEPVKNIPDLVNAFRKLKEEGIDLSESLELTDKRSVAAFNAFLTAADKIIPLREAVTGVESDMRNMADEMANNTAGSIKTLESAWEELMIAIYGNTGALRSFIDLCTDGIRALTELAQSADDAAEKAKLASKKIGEEAASDQMQRQSDLINAATEAYKKSGLSENEAFEKAKEDRINILRKALEKEKALQTQYDNENIQLNEDFKNRSFLKQALFMEKTDAQYKDAIQSTWDSYNRQLSRVVSLETQIENIQRMNLPDDSSTTTTTTNIDPNEQKRLAEQAAKERLRIQEELQQSELDLMEDGQEKEIQALVNAYNKKMATIKGASDEENQLRANLGELLQKDIQAIEKKYADERQQRLEEEAANNVDAIAERAALEQAALTHEYTMAMLDLDKQLAELGEGGSESEKRAIEEKKFQLTKEYALQSSQAVIDSLEEQLNQENLSADERIRITNELQDAKRQLAEEEAQAEIDAIKRVEEEEEKSKKKRIESLQEWLSFASEAVGAIGDLVGTIYDGKIQKIEEEQIANEEAGQREIERIQELEENGAITKEEAEARKRAAEEQTAAKNQELEKKKAELVKKQAIFDKGVQLAQTSIATARGIMEAMAMIPPNPVMAALIGAMGAIQVATILATPIPAYAEGTKNGSHPGGAALVGDGGKHELVMFNGKAWLTPDTPTLVDLPRGAKVFPDADRSMPDWGFAELASSVLPVSGDNAPVIINDYSRLERKMSDNNELMLLMLKYFKSHNNDIDFEIYKQLKL